VNDSQKTHDEQFINSQDHTSLETSLSIELLTTAIDKLTRSSLVPDHCLMTLAGDVTDVRNQALFGEI